jgi:hypothetical protein
MALASAAYALDRARVPVLALLARSERLQAVMRSRAARVNAWAAVGVLVALVAALTAPALMLVWTPLLLGVPHLVADVRYLLLPRYSPLQLRKRDLAVAAMLLATVWWSAPAMGGAAVVAAACLSPSAASWRRLGLATIAILACAAMWRWPIPASYLLVHAHNLVAVLLFGLVFGRGRVRRWLLAAVVGTSALLLLGALDPWLRRAALDQVSGYLLPLSALDRWSPSWCARLTVLFVFLQSLHYAIWLRLIPEQARQREGTRSFRASLRALEDELGAGLVVLLAALALAVIGVGVLDSLAARQWYLRLAGFHAYLELAFLARWAAR